QECGCDCSKCKSSEECIILREEIAKLCRKLNNSEQRNQELEIELSNLHRSRKEDEEKRDESIESYVEQNKRLREVYEDALQQNQDLESRILSLADELQAERARFDEALMTMTERLVDATEKMNKMEAQMVKSRKDCALVVQLLKCNQSVDKHFVTRQVNLFPSELKKKIKEELDWKDITHGITNGNFNKPRSKTTTELETVSNAKPCSCIKRSMHPMRRSKSVTFSTPLVSDAVVQNGVHKG
ncbi:Tight junction-associated protein 1, partial [Exaiptasia diaphana]